MVLAKGLPVISKDELYNEVSSIPNERDRALITMLYLVGARISEMVNSVRRSDITKAELDGNIYWVVRIRTLKKYDILEKVRVDEEHKKFVTQLREEYRNGPISIERDKRFLELVIEWINLLKPDEFLFPISRQFAWEIVKRYGMMPHYLRHLRLTHLVTEQGFTDQDLVQFTGWSDSKPARIYSHLRWQDIAKKI